MWLEERYEAHIEGNVCVVCIIGVVLEATVLQEIFCLNVKVKEKESETSVQSGRRWPLAITTFDDSSTQLVERASHSP
jgi:hypothetical protein